MQHYHGHARAIKVKPITGTAYSHMLVTEFTERLQLVATNNYNTLANLYTTNHYSKY
jgi:hypothetical protein